MQNKVPVYNIPLATASIKGKIFLFSKIKNTKELSQATTLVYNTSKDGVQFSDRKTLVHIFIGKKEIDYTELISLRISTLSNTQKKFVMTFEKIGVGVSTERFIAFSKNMKDWIVKEKISSLSFAKQATFIYKKNDRSQSFLYYADREIWVRTKKNIKQWDPAHIVINPRLDAFDSQPLEIVSCMEDSVGIYILYCSQVFSGSSTDVSIGGVLCSHLEPGKVVWRSNTPLWTGHFDKAEYFLPVGGERLKNNIFVYLASASGELTVITINLNGQQLHQAPGILDGKGPLQRVNDNPIISPRINVGWEELGTFNPGTYIDKDNFVHLFYRAVGMDGVSRIGYARSKDGIHFYNRSQSPVFQLYLQDLPHSISVDGRLKHNPLMYTSGGSWGGSEDPRIILIDDTVYMMYVAFEGWNSIRISLTSIHESDIQSEMWKWKKPVYISPPHEINKNWVLFPEKIRGKYAIINSIVPKISISYMDEIDSFNETSFIHSARLPGPQPGRTGYWDTFIRGVGPPPLKIKEGWLVMYHALDKRDSGRYKLGAMILDLKNPSKVLYRSNTPLLSPDATYENEGKPGVIYASGAVIKDDTLYIYYGGGDRLVCVATSPLVDFVDHIKNGKNPHISFSKVRII